VDLRLHRVTLPHLRVPAYLRDHTVTLRSPRLFYYGYTTGWLTRSAGCLPGFTTAFLPLYVIHLFCCSVDLIWLLNTTLPPAAPHTGCVLVRLRSTLRYVAGFGCGLHLPVVTGGRSPSHTWLDSCPSHNIALIIAVILLLLGRLPSPLYARWTIFRVFGVALFTCHLLPHWLLPFTGLVYALRYAFTFPTAFRPLRGWTHHYRMVLLHCSPLHICITV